MQVMVWHMHFIPVYILRYIKHIVLIIVVNNNITVPLMPKLMIAQIDLTSRTQVI